MINFLWVLLALGLVLLNAFFVAAEFGMVKLRDTRVKALKKNHGLRGRILVQVHTHLDAYLSACQLGITLASLGLGWVGEPAFAFLLEPVFQLLGITAPELVTVIAFFTAFSILSFLHIVVGELMPKSLAIRQPETVSLWTAAPLFVFYWGMYPAIRLLSACSNFLLRQANLDAIHSREHLYSTEEIKLILNASHSHGELTRAETEIIEHALDLVDINVTDVMRPQDEMVKLDIEQPIPQLLRTVSKHRYSRYPIYDKAKQEMIGVIHVKDLFAALYQRKIIDIKALMRPVLKVPHYLPALDLLRKFRKGMPHFALIYSNRDTLIGFVTLDNLLHILLGRIKDEFHKTQDDWIKNTDGTFTMRGDCSIYTVERALDIDITNLDNEEIDTIAGLILDRLGTLPEKKQRIEFEEFSAIIEKIEGTKIQKVKICPKPKNKKTESHH